MYVCEMRYVCLSVCGGGVHVLLHFSVSECGSQCVNVNLCGVRCVCVRVCVCVDLDQVPR